MGGDRHKEGDAIVKHSVYELAEYIQAQGGGARQAEGLVSLLEVGKQQVNESAKKFEVAVADHAVLVQKTKSG